MLPSRLAHTAGQALAKGDAQKSALCAGCYRNARSVRTRPERSPWALRFQTGTISEVMMADDVDAETERAANAARASVRRAHRGSSSNLLPLLLVVFAVLSLAMLVMTDRDVTQPAT